MGKSHIEGVREDVAVLKSEIVNLKECVEKINTNIETLNKRLFISNGQRSVISRLEGLEDKAKLMWAISAAVGLLALKTIWEVVTG